jgi:hypothetical protein
MSHFHNAAYARQLAGVYHAMVKEVDDHMGRVLNVAISGVRFILQHYCPRQP